MEDSNDFMVSGVGSGYRHAWDVSEVNRLLTTRGIYNNICVTFNLSSADDVNRKLDAVKDLVARGMCHPNDLLELKEIVRLHGGLDSGGYGEQSKAGIQESAKVKLVYRNGELKEVAIRKKILATEAQKNAVANARQYAHTEEANNKRRKSIVARRDGKVLGEV